LGKSAVARSDKLRRTRSLPLFRFGLVGLIIPFLPQPQVEGAQSSARVKQYRYTQSIPGLSLTVNRLKKHPRQGSGIKDSHVCIFAHPRFPCRRHIEIESRNVLCDRFSNLLLCSGALLRGMLDGLCTRVCTNKHAVLLRKFHCVTQPAIQKSD
jgi:hypothetical protein